MHLFNTFLENNTMPPLLRAPLDCSILIPVSLYSPVLSCTQGKVWDAVEMRWKCADAAGSSVGGHGGARDSLESGRVCEARDSDACGDDCGDDCGQGAGGLVGKLSALLHARGAEEPATAAETAGADSDRGLEGCGSEEWDDEDECVYVTPKQVICFASCFLFFFSFLASWFASQCMCTCTSDASSSVQR